MRALVLIIELHLLARRGTGRRLSGIVSGKPVKIMIGGRNREKETACSVSREFIGLAARRLPVDIQVVRS